MDGDISFWSTIMVTRLQYGIAGPYGSALWRIDSASPLFYDQIYYDSTFWQNSRGFFSAWMAAGTATASQLRVNNTTVTELIASVDIAWSGGVPTISAQSAKVITALIEDWGGGLYRIGFTFNTGTLSGAGSPWNGRFMLWPDSTGAGGYCFIGNPQAASNNGGNYQTFPSYHYETTGVAQPGDQYDKSLGAWWNASEGTIFCRARTRDIESGGANNHVLNFFNTANERISLLIGKPDVPSAQVYSVAGGVPTNLEAGPVGRADGMVNIALRYKANNYGVSVDGDPVILDTSIAVSSGLSTCRFGRYSALNSSNLLNGFIQQAAYWPYAASDEELINLSTFGI